MTETANPPDPFIAYLRGAAGESLEAVVEYDESGQEVRYEEQESRPPERLVADLRESEADEARRERVHEAGSLHGVVRLYDDGLLVHFPQGEEIGTVVALEPSQLRELNEFVRGALLRLAETDQTVEAVPDQY